MKSKGDFYGSRGVLKIHFSKSSNHLIRDTLSNCMISGTESVAGQQQEKELSRNVDSSKIVDLKLQIAALEDENGYLKVEVSRACHEQNLRSLVVASPTMANETLGDAGARGAESETKVVSRGRRLASPCDFKFSDAASLVSTGGWNVLSADCEIGSDITVSSDKTMKVKKDPSVSGPVVIDRQATSSNGGRHLYVFGRLEMKGVTLTGGYKTGVSGADGGAVVVNSGSAFFQECSFSGNTASGNGGAVLVWKGSASFQECSFSLNTAQSAGAVYLNSAGSALFQECSFNQNTASRQGDDLYVRYDAMSVTIINPTTSMDIFDSGNKLVTACTTTDTDSCADGGLPGHICTVPNPPTTPSSLTCTPDTTAPFISEIIPTQSTDCASDNNNNNVYHLNNCKATSNGISITIKGVSFVQTGTSSGMDKVTVGGVDCPHGSSWTNTEIVCTPAVASQVGSNLIVKVCTKNGKCTFQTPHPKLLSFLPPTITSIDPPGGTTKGGVATTIRGANFGPASEAVILLAGTMPWTMVVHVDDATITAISPVLSGNNNGNIVTAVTIGGQEGTSTYNYAAPTLTSVDPLAQTKTDGADGILMTLHGTDFANVDLNRITIVAKGGTVDVPCSSVTRVDYKTLTCMYPDGGAGGCTDRNIYVTVAGQETTETIPLCYVVPVEDNFCGIGEFKGIGASPDDSAKCICKPTYFSGAVSACIKCPEKSALCDQVGLHAPVVKPDYWRSDPTSPNLTTTPFYDCPLPDTCLGGNSTKRRCATGHDDTSPVCAICSPEYVLQGEQCLPCPGYTNDTAATAPLSAAVAVAGLIYMLIVTYYLSRPALSKETKSKVRRRLTLSFSRLTASAGSDDKLDRQPFANIMKSGTGNDDEDDELHLTPTEINMIYSEIDEGGTGSITMAEVHAYIENDEQDKDGSKNKSKDKIAEAKDDIEEQVGIVQDNAKRLSQPASEPAGTFNMPSVSLLDILPNVHDLLPGTFAVLAGAVDVPRLPSFLLGQYPLLNVDSLTLASVPGIELPAIPLRDFPGIDLPAGSPFAVLELPSISVANYPNVALPKLSFRVPSLQHPQLSMRVQQLHLDIGGTLMKLKLFLGFAQCVSFFPITFSTIHFPASFLNLSKFLELVSLDFLSVFGAGICQVATGFYRSFEFMFALLPAIVMATMLSYVFLLLIRTKKSKYTSESVVTRLYSLLFMVVYTLYTGVSTKMFRLFKCREIMGVWYLTADYRVVCGGEEYTTHSAMAVVGMLVYTFGIPLFIFNVLHRNRKYLHKSRCPQDELYMNDRVKKEYGSIYSDYTESNYAFDLLDLLRRLLLTGALILVGEQSNTQVFLGALLCQLWLLVVTVRRPYKAYWDNVLSILLSLQLVLIMLCGMALEMNRLTPEEAVDPYESTSFGLLMVTFSVIIIVTAVLAILVSIPCARDPLVSCWIKRVAGTPKKKKIDTGSDEKKKSISAGSGAGTCSETKESHITIEMTNVVSSTFVVSAVLDPVDACLVHLHAKFKIQRAVHAWVRKRQAEKKNKTIAAVLEK